MKRNSNKPAKQMRARRDITRQTKKKTKKGLTVALSLLTVVLLLALAYILISPSIDKTSNPFDVGVLGSFGNKEAYDYTNIHRMIRGNNPGVIYTLQDFFAHGLFVGEKAEEDIVRNKNAYNILVVGKDRVGSNTDVIMVVNFNADTQKVNILQIPRDSYVEDPINVNLSKRINAIYAYAYNQNIYKYGNKTQASHASVEHLESTVESTFGITIDNYFMIDLNGFVKIIDSIGGVTVDVPFDMYYNDEEQNLHIDLKQGVQVLDGSEAEQFVRFRNTYVLGDLGRVSAQKIFLAALMEKLLSPDWFSVDALTKVATTLIDYSVTGMSLTDLIGFIKKIDFDKFSADSITFYTAQGEGYFAKSGASLYSLYIDENLEIINSAFNLYNKKITQKHITMSEEYHSEYTVVDTDGSTASEIGDKPPQIIVVKPRPQPPADEAPTDEDPTDETPTDETPSVEEPTDEIPTDEEPTDEEPTDETPTDETPTDEIPTDEIPTDEIPTDEIPTDETPTEETPTDETPTDVTTEDTPNDETAVPDDSDDTYQPQDELL